MAGIPTSSDQVVHSVTSLDTSEVDDLNHRTKRYLITMGIRTACFAAVIVVDGWVRWAFVLGAVFLPWIAVLFANAHPPKVPAAVASPNVPLGRHLSGGVD